MLLVWPVKYQRRQLQPELVEITNANAVSHIKQPGKAPQRVASYKLCCSPDPDEEGYAYSSDFAESTKDGLDGLLSGYSDDNNNLMH